MSNEPSRVLALGENTRTRVIAQRLVFLGYQVDWALDAAEAAALVRRFSYQAVVGSLRDWPDGVFNLALTEGAQGRMAPGASGYAPPALIWLEHHAPGVGRSSGQASRSARRTPEA
ncbi:MAG: hypothetical protein U0132_18100 [Gemmatimonadaceae bacterium]